MHDDLIDRLRAARPETASELLAPNPLLLDRVLVTRPAPRVITPWRLASVAAVAAVLAAALVVLPSGSRAVAPTTRPALHMRAIVESTSTALSSGRAHVQFTSTSDGPGRYPQTSQFTVEFSGDNRSMSGTVDPGDGRGSPFPIANKIVDGQFYLQDGTRWVKDTNAANVSGTDAFGVDPRNFLAGVADAARFEQVAGDPGHLKATRLDNIPDFNLGLGERGDTKLTAFELWVDADNVVRSLLVTSEQTDKTYPLAQTQITKDAHGNIHKSLDPATMGEPVLVHTTQQYKVTFTDIGAPIAITAPPGAVPVAGKG